MNTALSKAISLFLCVLLLSSCAGMVMKLRLKDKHFPPEFGKQEHVLLFELFFKEKYQAKLKKVAAKYYQFPIEFVTTPNINELYPDKDKYRYTLGLRAAIERPSELPLDWVIVFDRKTGQGYQSPFPSGYYKQVFRTYLKEMQRRMETLGKSG
jgi:hypothetical protein